LHHQIPKHQKIRFRQEEVSKLSAMPSAQGQHSHWRRERRRRAAYRAGFVAAGSLGGALLILFAALAFLARSDWGMERLRLQAENAVQAIAGERATAAVGPASVAFEGVAPALQLHGIRLRNADSQAAIAEVGTVDFSIRLLPLLLGKLQLGSAMVSDATIAVAAMPTLEGQDWTNVLRDERGLVDPDLVVASAFKALHGAFDAIESGLLAEIDLSNITIALPEGERVRAVRIVEGTLSHASDDRIDISIEADVDGRPVELAGGVTRDAASGRISDVDLSITASADADEAVAGIPDSAGRLGAMSLSVTGGEEAVSRGQKLRLSAIIEKSELDFGARGLLTGNMQVDVTLAAGTKKIEIDRLLVQTGRTSLEFNGAFGPRPVAEGSGDRPVYRYELVSTKTMLAPDDSPEQPLDFMARINGTVDPETRVAAADRIVVKSGPGEILGTAQVELVPGKTPGVALALSVRDVQVAHAKQLWPWFAASKARVWALDHVFGGQIQTASIEFRVPPARLGNGVPLTGEEITGHFELNDTRFDTFGEIPPIRDANGAIDVRGNDVDVTLSSGAVHMPSGRMVIARNGTLSVKRPKQPPTIGKLDIDLEGDAAAIAELATFDPINGGRFMPFKPDDLSGGVKGHVIADIPLQKGVDAKTLEWIVALDYTGLSIAKPFDGQVLSKADGKMTIEPTQVTMSAKGTLNDVPANIALVEPLRADGPKRDRKIEFIIDDAARERIAPALSTLISGTMKVDVDDDDGGRRIAADLGDARFDIPWVGWSKGAGVPAVATFTMQKTGNSIRLSDFELTGDTFFIAGDITLAGGELASARFGKVRLNRGDDVSVAIDRSGRGYRVDVSGSSLDARAVIKALLSDKAGKAGSSGGSNVVVALDVARITGFNGETLSDAKINSRGSQITLAAALGAGGGLSLSSGSDGGRKQLRMQAADAGAILRFLDLYKNVRGGSIKLSLSGDEDGGMTGQVDAQNFQVIDEPRLASIVSTAPAGSGRSLSDAVRREIDMSSVSFERGYAQIARGPGYLRLANGVVRGPLIGATFQGTLYDPKGQMDMTGTFMPAYGLNRLFGEVPLFGELLGNGRDRGLIGVTFKLAGDAKSPRLQVNPLSVMAPGIFRQIFEFN